MKETLAHPRAFSTQDNRPPVIDGVAIETIIEPDGQRHYRIYLRERPGRGTFEITQAQEQGIAGQSSYGMWVDIRGQDGLDESLGLVPMEVFEQAKTDHGLTVITLNDQQQIASGQILWADDSDVIAPRVRHQA